MLIFDMINLVIFQLKTETVDGATHLEKFITNLQRERSEVAFHIFTYGKQSLALNLSERFTITDDALEQMPWPTIITNPNDPGVPRINIFKSKLRFQIRHGDFRERISQVYSIYRFYKIFFDSSVK